jgi:hypothetical protein
MFEKEAEEYARVNARQYLHSDGSRFTTSEEEVKQAVLYGYNKANEWHKQEVDDIYDLISEDWSVRYFICI